MGELSCGMTCVKYIFFAINFIFFLLGISVIAATIVVLVDDQNSVLSELLKKGDLDASPEDLANTIRTACYMFIAAGAFIVIVAFLGCCGAIKESKLFVGLYLFLIILVIALEIAAVVVAIIFVIWAPDNMTALLKQRVINEYTGDSPASDAFSNAVNSGQVWLKCCGIDGYTDYNNATNWKRNMTTEMVPLSCCILKDRDDFYANPSKAEAKYVNCQSAPSGTNSYYKQGCYDSLLDFVKRNSWVVGGLGLGVIAIQVLCIIFSCCLCRSFGKKDD